MLLLLLLLIFSYFKGAAASAADGTADGVAFDELSQDTGKEDKSGQGAGAWCPNFLQKHGELSHAIKTGISVIATIIIIFLIVSIIILLQRSDTDSWWIIFLVVLAAVCTCVCCCVLAILSDQLDFSLEKDDTGDASAADGSADADGAADGVSFGMGMGQSPIVSPNPLISAKEGFDVEPKHDTDAVICDINPGEHTTSFVCHAQLLCAGSSNESKGAMLVLAEPSAVVAAEEPAVAVLEPADQVVSDAAPAEEPAAAVLEPADQVISDAVPAEEPAAVEQSATVATEQPAAAATQQPAAAATQQPAAAATQQPVSDDDFCVELDEWTAKFGDSEESIAAFHEYDKDGDGKISSAELEDFCESDTAKRMYG